MPIVASQPNVPAGDDWTEAATFRFPPIDKLDLTAYNGAILVQYELTVGGFEPDAGVRVPRGQFVSVPGLSEVYKPGPTGVRFKRAVAGVAAAVDFTAYSIA